MAPITHSTRAIIGGLPQTERILFPPAKPRGFWLFKYFRPIFGYFFISHAMQRFHLSFDANEPAVFNVDSFRPSLFVRSINFSCCLTISSSSQDQLDFFHLNYCVHII